MTNSARRGAAGNTEGPEITEIDVDLVWTASQHRLLESIASLPDALGEALRTCGQVSVDVDQFFRRRVHQYPLLIEGGLSDDVARRPGPTVDELRAGLDAVAEAQDELFVQRLGPDLAAAGVHLLGWHELDESEQEWASQLFERRIYPVLTPMAVDPGRPFPYVSDLSLNLAVMVEDPNDGRRHFARVKVPGSFDQLIGLPAGRRFVPVEEVIVAHLDSLFPGMTVCSHDPFRVTRDEEVGRSGRDKAGRRSGRVVRLEVHHSMTTEVSGLLRRELDLGEAALYRRLALLDLRCLLSLAPLVESAPATGPRSRRLVGTALMMVVALVVLLILAILAL